MREKSTRGALVAVLLAAAAALGCVPIDSGHAGVKWTFLGGTQPDIYGEGVHLLPPWNRMYVYDVRVQDQVEDLQIITSNGLSVGMEMSIRYRARKDELATLHAEIGQAYYEKIISPVIRSEAREVVARYTPEQMYSTKRAELQGAVQEAVQRAMAGKHIELEAVLIRNVILPDKIKTAIEEKLEEEQKAQRMKFTLDREQQEAERKRIEAHGIAEFQKIVSTQISEALLRWKGIEATQLLAQSPNAKVVVIGSGKDGLPLILGGAN